MAGASSGNGLRVRQGSRRSRQQPGRRHRVHFSLTEHELAVVEEAAARAGLARGAYAAQVVLAAAGSEDDGPLSPQREALRQLIQASGLARRIGVNLNQAVARLNATGQRSGDLLPYAAESVRRAQLLDQAAEELRRRLRQ